jgi:hypothetical protein
MPVMQARYLQHVDAMRALTLIGILVACGCDASGTGDLSADLGDAAATVADGGPGDLPADAGLGPDAGLDAPVEDTDGPCTAARPTSIGGNVEGYPDKFSINAVIGVHLLDAQNRSVDGGGTLCSVAAGNCNGASNYAYFIRANPTLSPLGLPADTAGTTRRWSRCVSTSVKRMYLEGYPRNPEGRTDHTKYASTMSNYVALSGATVRYSMRFAETFEHGQGNTGNVNGWATCNGAPTQVLRINGWTREPSTACGIRAYKSGGNIENANGYWWIGPLVAGQCGAPSQPVGVVAHVNCNGVPMSRTRTIEIVKGTTVGAVNFAFP